MYFEDEKENMRNGGAFDDLEVDIDGDDKSVTWDDLLNDESDIDLANAKKGLVDDDALLDTSDDDMALLDDDSFEEAPPAPRQTVRRAAAPRKDAFDVFGGPADSGVHADNDSRYQERGDAFTPDLTNRQSARAKARMNDDDDIYFEPRRAKKSSSILPTVIGVMVAFAFIIGLGYVFLTYGKSDSIAKLDARSLFNTNKNTQEAPLIEDNDVNKPVIDINAPAEQNAANNADKKDEAKKEEQKFVTFSVTNGGRINPFTPPSGFEATTKFALSSDYEILSPPQEIPTDNTADDAKQLMDITVSGILFDNVKPSAIINVNGSEYFVQIGDKVDEFQVVAINSQYVAIKNGTNTYKAQVGESFTNAGGAVAGMAKRQASGKFAGARQYTSSSDVEVSVRD